MLITSEKKLIYYTVQWTVQLDIVEAGESLRT